MTSEKHPENDKPRDLLGQIQRGIDLVVRGAFAIARGIMGLLRGKRSKQD